MSLRSPGSRPLTSPVMETDATNPADAPVGMVEQLHADNERLRLRVLELMKLMEDEVTDKVEAEFRAEDWERQARRPGTRTGRPPQHQADAR